MEEPIVNDEPVIEAPETTEEVTEVSPPGAKTDPALLLEKLHEERDKRREEEKLRKEAEAELQRLKDVPEGEVVSEEGRMLQAEIRRLQAQVASSEESARLTNLQTKFPVLKDKESEFKDFLSDPENRGMKIETAARAFLTENSLLETPPARKGLERTTGGTRAPAKVGMTPEEMDDLRTTNYAEYRKRIKAGTLG